MKCFWSSFGIPHITRISAPLQTHLLFAVSHRSMSQSHWFYSILYSAPLISPLPPSHIFKHVSHLPFHSRFQNYHPSPGAAPCNDLYTREIWLAEPLAPRYHQDKVSTKSLTKHVVHLEFHPQINLLILPSPKFCSHLSQFWTAILSYSYMLTCQTLIFSFPRTSPQTPTPRLAAPVAPAPHAWVPGCSFVSL